MGFTFRRFAIEQDACAMKVNTDGCLLGAWAELPAGGRRILDIGTGTGVIALMMAQRYPMATVDAIDIDPAAAVQARANAAASPFADRVAVGLADTRTFAGGPYDAIVCNPPYFSASLTCPDAARTTARHDTQLSFAALAHAAARLLARGGKFSVVVPADRQRDMEDAAAAAGMRPARLCHVRTTAAKLPKRLLAEFTATYIYNVSSESLIVGDDRFRELLNPFYLHF